MTCASCVNSIETQLRKQPGVIKVAVNLMTEMAHVEFDRDQIGIRDIIDCIEDAGFNALLSTHETNTHDAQLESLSKIKEIREWRRAFWISFSFALPVFLIAMVLPATAWGHWLFEEAQTRIPGLYFGDVVQLVLTVPVQFGTGKRFYVASYKSLRHGAPTMDVLVMLSSTAAFAFSCFSIFHAIFVSPTHRKPAVFFDTSATLITFIMFGRLLENLAKGHTSTALSKLMSLTPSSATIYIKDPKTGAISSEKKIPTELIQVNDLLKIVPGDRIPADGVIISGSSSVDESMVTGESRPVSKTEGDLVIGGTVNGFGNLTMCATRVGSDTALSQIVKLVEDAQVSKAPIQGFADLVAGYFVPCVIFLGISTFVVWMVITNVVAMDHLPIIFRQADDGHMFVCLKLCISVIVVACPCALGLATPTAVMVGTGVGAQNGILIKGGGALEMGQKITKVVFDKTGTLTIGKLDIASVGVWDLRLVLAGADDGGDQRKG